MNTEQNETGTVMVDIPEDMTFSEIRTILTAIRDATGQEIDMGVTLPNTFSFYGITENQSDFIYATLVSVFGEGFVQDSLGYCYDNDFQEDEEEDGE